MDSTPLKVWSVSKTAALLGMSNENVRNLVRRGELTPAAVTAGAKRVSWFFAPDDVLAVLERRQAALKARQQQARKAERNIPDGI